MRDRAGLSDDVMGQMNGRVSLLWEERRLYGAWRVIEDQMTVTTNWGEAQAPLGRLKTWPDTLARLLLAQLLKEERSQRRGLPATLAAAPQEGV
ncbi:MAG: hypothetical protein ABW003_20910 [Microvirga sp.]